MRSVLAQRTIVLVGSWNLAILNPGWVAEVIFEAAGVEAELIVADAGMRVKFNHGNVSVAPEPGRVVIGSLQETDDCLNASERIARRLLQQLPVTPVSAFGINFGYVEEHVPQGVAELFNGQDIAAYGAQGLAIRGSELRRRLQFEDRELRMRLALNEGAGLDIRLNYHKRVANADEAQAALAERPVRFRQHAERLLAAVYELQLDRDEPNGE